MRLLTAAEQRELDRLAASEADLPTRVLMENAGASVARVVAAMRPRSVVVYCGPGNNGGDGFVAARCLRDSAYVTCVATSPDKLRGDALAAKDAYGGPLVPLEEAAQADVVIDALFGTGLSRAPAGVEAKAIEAIHRARAAGARVVAVDVPSGIDADTGAIYPVHVAADETVTLDLPKRGLYLHPAAELAGRVHVADIGIPHALRDKLAGPACELVDEEWARERFPPRPRNAHKNDFGHLLVVAGSPGKAGAAAMVCEGALRAGVGLVTLAARPELQAVLHGLPEAMFAPLAGEGPLSSKDLPALREALKGKTALAFGPGIERGPETAALIGALLAEAEAAVIDADGLNALAGHRDEIAGFMRKAPSPVVLTPHPGEFARLTGEESERILADRVDAATRAAQRFGACIVLKGAHTVVADPEGTSAICAAGNPGMATAGAGDVLTGITGAFLARRAAPGGSGDRARLAVFAHAFAGDLAAQEVSETALIATDIARVGLPRLFRRWKR
ncbi:MAG TPA: NAD(P)H-hydrate dehydratase [Myxococcales bacterium]|nr:NAD(P)H-hydrate dehydratase [Myxococcales bacterium]